MKITRVEFVIVATLCSTGMRGADQTISSRDIPEVVRTAFAKAYPSAKIDKWEKETKNGKAVFEAETTDGNAHRNIMYSPDGNVVQIEETMSPADLPAEIRGAVQQQYPKAVINSTEKVTLGNSVEYKLGLKNAAKKRIVVRADGSVVQ